MTSLSGCGNTIEESRYNCDLEALWLNEVYEKPDTVNFIGSSFYMHFVDFAVVDGEIFAYYIFWEDNSFKVGLAKSTDGINFTNHGKVLDIGEPGTYGDLYSSFPSIWYDNGTFYLVHEAMPQGGGCDIALATSTDGYNFKKQGIILRHSESGWDSVDVGTPDLYKEGETWYLFFHGFDWTDVQIGVATGTNLFNLAKSPLNPIIPTSAAGPDSGTTGKRDVIRYKDYYYMVYETTTAQVPGYGFTKADSTHMFARSKDLIHWVKYPQKNIITQTENCFGNDGPAFLILDGITWIYYRDAATCFTRRARLANEQNGDYDRLFKAGGEGMLHQIGRADGEGWSAKMKKDEEGYLVYGPYVEDIPPGENIAVFKMKIDNNTEDDNIVVKLEVVHCDDTRIKETILAERSVKRKMFTLTGHYEYFSVPFMNNKSGGSLQFRVYWYKQADMSIERILVNYDVMMAR